jgi:hypothetical protein
MKSLQVLETEIARINERNKRVEMDKAWETSVTRRVFISISTYLLISVFMMALGVEKPFISAIIPAVAYLISTLSLGVVKSWWMRKQR